MSELEQYLIDRGLTADTVKAFGVRPNGTTIIVPTEAGDRLVTPGENPKIKWGQPVTRMPLFPSTEAARASNLIVEGEFDAMLATQELGRPVVTGTGGASTWLEEWSEPFAGREVTILYDNDQAGSKGAEKVADSLRRHGSTPRIARWPEDKAKGYDVTDYFREGGTTEVLEAIIASAEEFSLPGMSLTSEEFLALDIAPIRFLINRLWPEKAIGFVAGPPKSYKSFIALEMAFAISSGRPFLGRFGVEAPRKVLVIQQESAKAAYQARVHNASQTYGANRNLYILSNFHLSLEDESSGERLETEIDRVRPSLVVLDPLASFIEGDENSASEMGAVVRFLRKLRDAYDTGFLIVHHSSKTNGKVSTERGGMRMRGSSVFYAAAEAGLWVERVDEEMPRSRVRPELKETEPVEPFQIELNGETGTLAYNMQTLREVVRDINTMEQTKMAYKYDGEEDYGYGG